MAQILEFISRAEVKAQEYTNSAEVTVYVGTTPLLEIYQHVRSCDCGKQTLFCITIINTSDQDIKNLEFIDWICSRDHFAIKCVQLQEGYYRLSCDHVLFYIPLLKSKEQLCITVSLCSHPDACITNFIKTTNYSIS